MPFRSLRSSEMIKGPATMKMSAHLSWAAILSNASLGAVVVLARRSGYANRTDHVVADLYWREHARR